MGMGGMNARLLPTFIKSMVGEQYEEEDDPIIDNTLIDELSRVLSAIHYDEPRQVSLSNEAKRIRRKCNNDLQSAYSEGVLRNYADEFNKLTTQACQAAWIFACVEAGGVVSEISAKAMQQGVDYMKYRVENALLFYTSYEASIMYENAQHLIEWVSDWKNHPTRDIYFLNDEMKPSGFKLSTLKNNLSRNKMRPHLEAIMGILLENRLVRDLGKGAYMFCWLPAHE